MNSCLLRTINTAAPYLGIVGEVNLSDMLDNDNDTNYGSAGASTGFSYNDFYRSLGVAPPNSDAIWIVYEYAGLSTIQSYSVPPAIRLRSSSQQQEQQQQQQPNSRGGIFGMLFGGNRNNINSKALPSFEGKLPMRLSASVELEKARVVARRAVTPPHFYFRFEHLVTGC